MTTDLLQQALDALKSIDARLRYCFKAPISAEEAYDSFYQEIVAETIAAIEAAKAQPVEDAADCRTTCDVCWDESGARWPCAKETARRSTRHPKASQPSPAVELPVVAWTWKEYPHSRRLEFYEPKTFDKGSKRALTYLDEAASEIAAAQGAKS